MSGNGRDGENSLSRSDENKKRYQTLIETIHDFVWEIDANGKYTFCSPQMKTLWGIDPSSMIGRTPFDILPDARKRQVQKIFIDMTRTERPFHGLEIESCDAYGNAIWLEVSGAPYFDSKSRLLGYRGISRDVTEKRKIQQALAKSQEEYRNLVENSNSIIMKVDKHMNIKFMNDFGLKFYGYTKQEIIGKNVLGTTIPLTDSDGRDLAEMVENIRNNPRRYKTNINQNMRKNGELVWVTWTNNPSYDNDGNLIEILAVGNDISRLKETENKLRLSEKRFRSIVQYAPTLIFEIDFRKQKFIIVNDIMCEYLGYTRDELLHMNPFDVIDDEYKDVFKRRMKLWLNNEKPDENVEVKIHTRDRHVKHLMLNATFTKDKFGRPAGAMVIAQDITERKKIEDALRDNMTLLDTVLTSMNDAVVTIDKGWNVIGFNDAFAKFCRFESKEECQPSLDDFRKLLRIYTIQGTFVPVDDWPPARALQGETGSGYEYIIERPDIFERWFANVSFSPLKDKKNRIIGAVTTMHDITQHKKVERALHQLLVEKETLLKEVHHRVKNNMQIIYSLMNMQARRTSNKYLKRALEDSQSRIKSMALIHETLYRSENISAVSMSDYIRDLLTYLSQSFRNNDAIRIDVDVEPIPLELSKAIACGLIVNELVSNSLKYAFVNRERGTILISLKRGDYAELRISDDGIGLPKGINALKLRSLGLQLVETLTKQLDGNLEIKTGEGTEFRISFPAGDKDG